MRRAFRPLPTIRLRIAAVVALAAFSVLAAGCSDDDDDDDSPSDLAIVELTADAMPSIGDDVVRVRFSRGAVEAEAVNVANYQVESPPGSPLPLLGASASYDAATTTTTIVFGGTRPNDAVNLAVGAPLRVIANGIHASDGGVLPPFTVADATVGGTNPGPAIIALSPNSAATPGAVDVTVSASGLTFAADTTVTLGGVPLTGLVMVDSFTLRGRAGRSSPGQKDAVIANSNGSSTATGAFTYVTPFPLFDGALSHFVAAQPFGVDMGDLDNDGLTDVVAVNFGSQVLTLHRGRGNGDFDPPIVITTAQAPTDVLLEDVDGNGFLDLVYANSGNIDGSGNGSVSVRLGTGGLAFGGAISATAQRNPISLTSGDFDGDGDVDFTVVNANTGSLSVFRNEGLGFLNRITNVSISGGPQAASAIDFDGDGDLDLAVALGQDQVQVLTNDGASNFTFVLPAMPAGDFPRGIAASDVDGDGVADLAVANLLSDDASAFFGSPGAFTPEVRVPIGFHPIQVRVADLFGTGVAHLVTALNLGFGVSYVSHAGARTFSAPTFVRTGRTPHDLAVKPLVSGGLPAIVTANREADSFTVVLHRPDGSLLVPIIVAADEKPLATALADFDENGTLDVGYVSNAMTSKLARVLFGDGAGGFAPGASMPAGDSPSDVLAADFDGDAHADLLVADMFRNAVLFFRGDGAGSFAAPVSSLVGSIPEKIFPLDLDADGDLDVCSTLTNPQTIGVALNDGSGTFVLPTPTSEFGAGGDPMSIHSAGDFDGDGNVDLAVAGDAGNIGQMGVLFGDGTGIFNEFQGTLTFENNHAIAMGDVNGDGFLDLVGAGRNPSDAVSRFRVVIGNGTRPIPQSGMSDPRNFAIQVGSVPERIKLRDVDSDGDLDAVVSLAATNAGVSPIGVGAIAILINDGSGTFTTSHLLASGLGTFHVSMGDVNGDGSIDIVAADSSQGTISIYLGRG